MATDFKIKDSDDGDDDSDGEEEDEEPTFHRKKEKTWIEIVHLDIKLQNILLADWNDGPDEQKLIIRRWPKVQLTDFGVAVELRQEFRNSQDYTGRGTQGYQAPEQLRQISRDVAKYPTTALGAKTNIWGIGAVLHDMMNP